LDLGFESHGFVDEDWIATFEELADEEPDLPSMARIFLAIEQPILNMVAAAPKSPPNSTILTPRLPSTLLAVSVKQITPP